MALFHKQTKLYGIFGYPIGHSLSPLMHNTAFAHHGIEAVYLPFAVHPSHIRRAVKSIVALQMGGVNVTIPHKEAVLAWMDELAPAARLIGAVNTIHLQDGRLHGHNTDGIGFLNALNEAGSAVTGQTVMLLGAGGAARAIAVQLCLSGIRRLLLTNRTPARAEHLAAFLKQNIPHADISVIAMGESSLAAMLPDTDIVVNATSIGMRPQDPLILPSTALSPRHMVCDIVYRPLQTPLLRAAKRQGARTFDGLGHVAPPRGESLRDLDCTCVSTRSDPSQVVGNCHRTASYLDSATERVNETMAARLGELLLRANLITKAQLDQAIAQQRVEGGRLGTLLTKLGWVKEEDISRCLGEQYGVPYIDLDSQTIPSEVIRLIPPGIVQKHLVIPIGKGVTTLTIAMADPTNLFAVDDIKFMTGLKVEAMVATESAVRRALDRFYDSSETLQNMMASIEDAGMEVMEEQHEYQSEHQRP